MTEEETLGGREGGRWAAQEEVAGRPGGKLALPVGVLGDPGFPPLGSEFPPGRPSVGGTPLVAQNGSNRTENGCFPEGAGPAPQPDSQPTWSTSTGPVGAGLG